MKLSETEVTEQWRPAEPGSPDRTFGKYTEYFSVENGGIVEGNDFVMVVTLFTDFETDSLTASVCFRRTMGVNLPVKCFHKTLGDHRKYLEEHQSMPEVEDLAEEARQVLDRNREEILEDL